MTNRERELEGILRDMMALDWVPDAAPGPSCYMVSPVWKARDALRRASILLDGKSMFPSDNNGTASYGVDQEGKITTLGVWFDGMCYDEKHRDKVPEKYLKIFDEAILKVRGRAGSA